MQRTRTIKLNSSFKFILKNSGYLLLILLFLISFLIGCIFVFKNNSLLDYIKSEMETFITIRKEGNFGSLLFNSILFILPFPLISFVCGTSIVGCVLSPLFLIYKGFIYGAYLGYIYGTYQLIGIVFNALVFLPFSIISIMSLVLSVRESIGFSVVLAGICIKGKKNTNIFIDFENYCYRHLVILGLVVVSIILDLGCSALFIKFFNF